MAKSKPSLDDVKNYVQIFLETLQKEKLPIERVLLYGSHAKGKARRWSDIDVCVISSKFRDRGQAIEYLWTKRCDDDVEHGINRLAFIRKILSMKTLWLGKSKPRALKFGRTARAGLQPAKRNAGGKVFPQKRHEKPASYILRNNADPKSSNNQTRPARAPQKV